MVEHGVSLIDGTASQVGQSIDVIDPFTGEFIGATHESGGETVDRAVSAASRTFEDWSRIPVDERAAVLERAADLLDERSADVASTVTLEMGMPIRLSTVTQSQLPASVLRAAAATARTFPWIEDIDGAQLRRWVQQSHDTPAGGRSKPG